MTAAINDFVEEWSQHLNLISVKTSTLTLKFKTMKRNTTYLSETRLPTLSGNEAQIQIRSSTRHLESGGSLSSSSVHHYGNR